MIITISRLERNIGKLVGSARMKESKRKNRKPAWIGTIKDGGGLLTNHQDGACSELVAAKILQTYYEPRINNFKGADLLTNIEVRSTKVSWFGVKLRDRDGDDRIVIAVRKVNSLEWRCLGWIKAKDGKKKKWLKDPGGRGVYAYFVPIDALEPIETLPVVRTKEA